jgi:copper transport protein
LTTTYGLLIVAKVACALLIVALGALARRFVQRHVHGRRRWLPTPSLIAHAHSGAEVPVADGAREVPSRAVARRFRQGLLLEALLGVAVLVLTSFLTGTAQARTAYAPSIHRTLAAASVQLRVDVSPAKVGPTVLRVEVKQLVASGDQLRLTGTLSDTVRGLGPFPVVFTASGPRQFSAATSWLASGRWTLNLVLQTSPIDATTFQTEIPVRSAAG